MFKILIKWPVLEEMFNLLIFETPTPSLHSWKMMSRDLCLFKPSHFGAVVCTHLQVHNMNSSDEIKELNCGCLSARYNFQHGIFKFIFLLSVFPWIHSGSHQFKSIAWKMKKGYSRLHEGTRVGWAMQSSPFKLIIYTSVAVSAQSCLPVFGTHSISPMEFRTGLCSVFILIILKSTQCLFYASIKKPWTQQHIHLFVLCLQIVQVKP